MKKIIISIAALTTLLATAYAGASSFDGFYMGAKAGTDYSKVSGAANLSNIYAFAAGEAGYNWTNDNILFGANLWADNHQKTSATGRDYGADLKLGSVQNKNTLFYVKLGMAATNPGNRLHYGLGLEHIFAPHWGGLVEWTGDKKTKDAVTYRNDNYMVGVNYHF